MVAVVGSGAWVFGCWPTPGDPNELRDAVAALCPLPETIPASILSAECGSPGDSIWSYGSWRNGEFWLKSRSMWGLFLE